MKILSSYVWDAGWVEAAFEANRHLDCATSWRHRFGTTRGFEIHKWRFESVTGPLPPGFWEGVWERLDPTADLFPRVSVSEGKWILEVRPAPAVRETTSLTHLPHLDAPDPRHYPHLKGPDFARFKEHREKYLLAGTDDIVLGDFAETTTGALVGWEDTTLILPEEPSLPSTTQALVVEHARELSIPVNYGRLSPHKPMWFLNALHGISPVESLVSHAGSATLPRHPDEAAWRAWWWGADDSAKHLGALHCE